MALYYHGRTRVRQIEACPGVWSENLVAMLHPLWPIGHACLDGFGLFMCQICVWDTTLAAFLSKIGSRGRARTCNPPVNSRLLYH